MPKHRVSKFKRSRARNLRRALTDAELKLWQLLRSQQLARIKFRRQVPIGPWIVDFVAFEQMLIIEADGSQHVENFSDKKRDADLQGRGFRILRFWNNDILQHTSGVLEQIIETIKRDPLTPRPSAATLSHRGRGLKSNTRQCHALS